MKVSEKIEASKAEGRTFFSFEYFPPKTAEGVVNLKERLKRMVATGPNFCDITWGAGGTTADATLDIATYMQKEAGVETMMHLTCTNMEKSMIDAALAQAKEAGITNILALRGDPPAGQERWTAVEGGFANAVDLVRYIKTKYGDWFGISVAGYPEGHIELNDYGADLRHLEEKVEAGADVIVTQLFYSADIFIKFVKDCRDLGITVPIVPGIMPIQNYGGFKRMTGFCKTYIPDEISESLESIKEDDDAVKAYGVELAVQMIRKCMKAGACDGFHIYTLNLEKSAFAILEALGLGVQVASAALA